MIKLKAPRWWRALRNANRKNNKLDLKHPVGKCPEPGNEKPEMKLLTCSMMVSSNDKSPVDALASRIGMEIIAQGLCEVVEETPPEFNGRLKKYHVHVIVAAVKKK